MPSVFWLRCLPCQWPFPAVSWEADGGQRSSRSPGSCPGLHLKCHVSGPALSDQLGSRLCNHDPALLRCPTLVMLGKNLRSSWVTASMTKWRRWSSSKKTGSLFWCLHWISHRSVGEVAWFEMLDAHLGHWAARAGGPWSDIEAAGVNGMAAVVLSEDIGVEAGTSKDRDRDSKEEVETPVGYT